MEMNNKALLLEQEFNTPIEIVWRAITEKGLMKKWYFDIPDFEPEAGHKFQFEGGEKKQPLHSSLQSAGSDPP